MLDNEEKQLMNNYTLTGRIENIEEKQLNGGKKLYKLRVKTSWGSGQYTKQGCIEMTYWGSAAGLKQGTVCVIVGEVQGREYQGKWYIDLVTREVHALAVRAASHEDGFQEDPPDETDQSESRQSRGSNPPWVNEDL